MSKLNSSTIKEINFEYQTTFKKIFSKNKFVIHDTTNFLNESKFIQKLNIENIQAEINTYTKNTGIMIDYIPISKDNFIYLFIFEYEIIIIHEINLLKFLDFFNELLNNHQTFYFSNDCHQQVIDLKSKTIEVLTQNNNQTDLSQKIYIQIIRCILKKSQARTKARRHKLSKNAEKNFIFQYDDFITLSSWKETNPLQFVIQYYRSISLYSKNFY